MAEDTDIYFQSSGMAGGHYSNIDMMADELNDVAVNRPCIALNHQTNQEPLMADIFSNVSVRGRQHIVHKEPSSPQMYSDDSSQVINLKQSKKVLGPSESPSVPISALLPKLTRQVSIKRKRVEPLNLKIEGKTRKNDIIENADQFIKAINLNVKEHGHPMKEVKGMVFDSQFFTGNFKPEESLITKPAGSGTNGQVVRFDDPITGKKLTKKTIPLGGKERKQLHPNEVKVPLRFNSENLAKMVGLGFDGAQALVIMEDAGLNLRQWVSRPEFKKHLQQPEVMETVAADILAGLSTLADSDIAHRDLKPENVCLDIAPERRGGVIAKLIDLASSQSPNDPLSFSDITPEYLDPAFNAFYVKAVRAKKLPEQHLIRCLNTKDDIWAFGLILLFVLWEGHPMILHHLGVKEYPEDKVEALRMPVLEQIGEMKSLPEKFLSFPGNPVLAIILGLALNLDRDERPTARELRALLPDPSGVEWQSKRRRVEQPMEQDVVSETAGGILKLKVSRFSPGAEQSDYNNVMIDKKKRGKVAMSCEVEQGVDTDHGELMKGIRGIELKNTKTPQPSMIRVEPPVGKKIVNFGQPRSKKASPLGSNGYIELNTTPAQRGGAVPAEFGLSMRADKVHPASAQHHLTDVVMLHGAKEASCPVQKVEEAGDRGSCEDLVNFFLGMDDVKSVQKAVPTVVAQHGGRRISRFPISSIFEPPSQQRPSGTMQMMGHGMFSGESIEAPVFHFGKPNPGSPVTEFTPPASLRQPNHTATITSAETIRREATITPAESTRGEATISSAESTRGEATITSTESTGGEANMPDLAALFSPNQMLLD